MIEEKLSGFLPPNFDIDNYIDTLYSMHGNCEASSFTLCYRLAPDRCYVAMSGDHAFVLYDQAVWVDLHCGVLLNKKLTAFQRLKNFNQKRYNKYWGANGTITRGDYIFHFIKISYVRKAKIK